MDFPGNNLDLVSELSWEQCIDKCLKSKECLSVSYKALGGECFRKRKAFNESESKQTFSFISMNMECLTGKYAAFW